MDLVLDPIALQYQRSKSAQVTMVGEPNLLAGRDKHGLRRTRPRGGGSKHHPLRLASAAGRWWSPRADVFRLAARDVI